MDWSKRQAEIRQLIIDRFRERGIEVDLRELLRYYQGVNPEYAAALADLLGMEEIITQEGVAPIE